jgi:hypothetical protein
VARCVGSLDGMVGQKRRFSTSCSVATTLRRTMIGGLRKPGGGEGSAAAWVTPLDSRCGHGPGEVPRWMVADGCHTPGHGFDRFQSLHCPPVDPLIESRVPAHMTSNFLRMLLTCLKKPPVSLVSAQPNQSLFGDASASMVLPIASDDSRAFVACTQYIGRYLVDSKGCHAVHSAFRVVCRWLPR